MDSESFSEDRWEHDLSELSDPETRAFFEQSNHR